MDRRSYGLAGADPGTHSKHPGWPAQLGPLLVDAGQVALRPPRLRDGPTWSRLRIRDRDYLRLWEPTTSGEWTQRNSVFAWFGQWHGLHAAARRGFALPFVITVNDQFAGQITVGNIVRGSLRSAWVGYWVTETFAGQGVATAALALIVDHAFGHGRLHRLEATVRPENAASRQVLDKAGFREEGLFHRYLDVAGRWRDHYCYALTVEDLPRGAVTRLVDADKARPPEDA